MAFAKWFQFLFPLILFTFCVCFDDFKIKYMKVLMAVNLKITLLLMRYVYKNNFNDDEEIADSKKTS